jgi:cobalt/nickel transport system ATP-binding protein
VFSDAHRIVAEGSPTEILGDRDLLLSVNLIHEHGHVHGGDAEAHVHEHGPEHHEDEKAAGESRPATG